MTDTRVCPACSSAASREAGEKSGYRLVRCRDCATLYMADLPTAETLHDYYGTYYGAANLSTPEFVSRRLDEIVAGFGGYRKTNRLLDVGCGAATLLEAARRAGWETHGTEVSEAAVDNARKRGFDVFHGALADAPYVPGQFDVITAVEVLEHLTDPSALLQQAARLLRPGGLLWATTPHSRGLTSRLLGTPWSVVSPPEHIQLFSVSGMRLLLARSGYDGIRIDTHGVNPLEIVRHFRRREAPQNDRVASAYALNERMSRPSTRVVKTAVNHILTLTKLGDGLKIYAERK